MDSLLEFLNQPIVLTIITLLVGSILLDLVTERRSRRDKLRDQAIQYLTEASNYIGDLTPQIYERLRTGNLTATPEMADGLKNLFSRRMSIQVGSQAYLQSPEFARQYLELINEFPGVIEAIQKVERGEDADDILLGIQRHRDRLRETWPLPGEALHPQTGEPVDALILWMDLVMHRLTDLISSHLRAVLD